MKVSTLALTISKQSHPHSIVRRAAFWRRKEALLVPPCSYQHCVTLCVMRPHMVIQRLGTTEWASNGGTRIEIQLLDSRHILSVAHVTKPSSIACIIC